MAGLWTSPPSGGGDCCHHYQIALGLKLRTAALLPSALASQRRNPCRFRYEIVRADTTAAPR